MNLAQEFNAINGTIVNRKTLDYLLARAEKERHALIQTRIVKVLEAHPEKNEFKITLTSLVEPYGLNAERHSGLEKEALTECGRLKKGYKYIKGKGVVKVAKKPVEKAKKLAKNKKLIIAKPVAITEVKKNKVNAQTPTKPNNKVDKNVNPNKKTTKKVIINKNDVLSLPISKIFTDEKRFQNRTKLNETILQQIVANYSESKFDAIVIWHDKKTKKDYVLAGHHRFEAVKRLGNKNIAAKYFTASETEAIHYAKVESNANRSLELPQERAKIYREMRKDRFSKAEILEKAKSLEGKNANYIVNLSYLTENGITLQALNQLADTPDKQNATIIEKTADWIGEALKNNAKLNETHETEMFKFLMDIESAKRIKSKAQFLQVIHSIAGSLVFHSYEPLNLKRFKYKTEGENAYDNEYKDLQNQLEKAIENKQNLVDRIKNPNHKDFIKPTDKDYKQVIVALEKAIDKYNTEIKLFQSKLIELSRKKGSYTNAGSNQVGLFGGLKVSSEYFKKMSVSELRKFTLDYYNQHLKGKKVAIKNHLKEVSFTANGGKKLHTPMYSAKALVIEHLENLIKNSTYNNFGTRKSTDSKDILGYLNFKAKLSIDGKKKHVRISVILDSQRKTKFKSFDLGAKKENVLPIKAQAICNSLDEGKTLYNNKDNKNNTNIPNISENGLKAVAKRSSLAHKMANRNTNFEYFDINDKDISEFLGQIEKKEKESIVISLTGGQGSMKTRFAFQFMNALAQKYNCGHASIEEHPESKLYFDKADQYLNEKALNNIEAPEIKNISDLEKLIKNNDVIIIDSYAKMQEIEKGFEVDKDLRKKYNGKLFLVIFQQTSDGKMRGGSKSQFDADIVLFTEKKDDYKNNYVYADKNRYQSKSLDTLHFNIFSGTLNKNNDVVVGNSNTTITPVLKGTKLSFTIN